MILAHEHLEPFRIQIRIVLGLLLSAVPAWIALDAWFSDNGRPVAGEDVSANIVGVIMAAVTFALWFYIARITLTHRRLRTRTTLVETTLRQGSSTVDLEHCRVKPLVKNKGFLWPMSEAVIFEDGDSRILLAPSLLADVSQEALRMAWRRAGKELLEYHVDALQDKHAPTGLGQG